MQTRQLFRFEERTKFGLCLQVDKGKPTKKTGDFIINDRALLKFKKVKRRKKGRETKLLCTVVTNNEKLKSQKMSTNPGKSPTTGHASKGKARTREQRI